MSDLSTPQLAPVGASAPLANPTPAPPPRLVNAAHEFEASMMKELMGPLTSGKDSLDGDTDGSDSALTSFAGEAMAKAISDRGGFGIATKILHQLSAAGNHSGKSNVPAGRNGTPTNSPIL